MKEPISRSRTAGFELTSSFRHKTLLVGIAILITVIGLAAVILCVTVLNTSSHFSDRLAEVGDITAAATLLLALAAAIVALLAYAASTGLPDLRIQVDFPFSELNRPIFSSTPQENGSSQAENFKQLSCAVRVRNYSNYSAKNPAIVIRLHDMAFLPDGGQAGIREWAVIQFISTHGVTVVQWDGGSNYSIHGNSIRTLPDLSLNQLHTIPNADPYIDIDILAEGYTRQVRIPVEFKVGLPYCSPEKYADGEAKWL